MLELDGTEGVVAAVHTTLALAETLTRRCSQRSAGSSSSSTCSGSACCCCCCCCCDCCWAPSQPSGSRSASGGSGQGYWGVGRAASRDETSTVCGLGRCGCWVSGALVACPLSNSCSCKPLQRSSRTAAARREHTRLCSRDRALAAKDWTEAAGREWHARGIHGGAAAPGNEQLTPTPKSPPPSTHAGPSPGGHSTPPSTIFPASGLAAGACTCWGCWGMRQHDAREAHKAGQAGENMMSSGCTPNMETMPPFPPSLPA
eukprot:1158101-Pelagomonas_calceolata.AAC.10